MTSTRGGSSPESANRLRFETLISDLSARFVLIPGDEMDRAIEDAMERIRGFFRMDRCGLIQVREHREMAYLSHPAYAEGLKKWRGTQAAWPVTNH